MSDLITLIDEEGIEQEFEVDAFLDVAGERYAVLVPQTDNLENEAIILRFGKDENGEDILLDIEDDEEWEKVADAYDEYLGEDYE